MPSTTLPMVYNNVFVISPVRRRFIFSKANAENVVKPPHTPVIRNSRQSAVITALFSEAAKKIPIKKQPTMFTRNVPQGKGCGYNW